MLGDAFLPLEVYDRCIRPSTFANKKLEIQDRKLGKDYSIGVSMCRTLLHGNVSWILYSGTPLYGKLVDTIDPLSAAIFDICRATV